MNGYNKALSVLSIFLCCNFLICNSADKKFVIVTTSYKNSKVYEKNLDSVFAQKADNWRMIYVDDNSPDNTGELVEQYVKKHNFQHKIKVVRNEKRVGALENIVTAVHSCQNDEIIVSLDGDDWFASDNVLNLLNEAYQDPNVWLTFGSFKFLHNNQKCFWLKDYPQEIKKVNAYRSYSKMVPSHLRTFYAGLFKKININDLKQDGKFFEMAWDVAFMIPMLEMTGGRYKCIEEVLYIYNNLNEINDYKVDLAKQESLDRLIRSRDQYAPITVAPYKG